jgi:phosphoribosyl-AMP cyclohydrolase
LKKHTVRSIDFSKGAGLVPVVARDSTSGRVLMVAYANREAVLRTLTTGFAHYFSRSRNKLWKKGSESGHLQRVRQVKLDCDRDALLYEVDQTESSCHTGEENCFFTVLEHKGRNEYDEAMAAAIVELFEGARTETRKWMPDKSRKHYYYLVNPITEGIPPTPPEVLEWIVDKLDVVAAKHADKIVTFEALGIPYATLLAQRRKKPLAIIRKRDFGAPEHLLAKVPYASGFERGHYFVYGLSKGETVILIDDMVSTGGSLIPTIEALKRKGVLISDILCIAEKPDYGGSKQVKRMTGERVKVLFRVGLKDGEIDARATPLLLRLLRK